MPIVSQKTYEPGEKKGGWTVKLIPNVGQLPKVEKPAEPAPEEPKPEE